MITNRKALNLPPVLIFIALLLTGFSCYSAQDSADAQIMADQTLEPTRDHIITNFQILRILNNHYNEQLIDDSLSKRMLSQYLKSLDPSHMIFLQADVDEFRASEIKLDDFLKKGDLRLGFEIYKRHNQRLQQALEYSLSLIKTGVDAFDFTKDESISIDREGAPFPANSTEFKDLWRKRVKNQALNLLLTDKEPERVNELLTKRFTNQLNRLGRSKSEDVFERYMNSLTATYDPHTEYFSPHLSENFQIQMSLQLQGIGAKLTTEDEYTKIVELIPGGPAEKSEELHASDRIIGVAQSDKGEMLDVVGWRIDEVVEKIRGEKGSVVRLQIIPHNAVDDTNTKIVRLVRDQIKLEDSAAKKHRVILEDGDNEFSLGVIELPSFYLDFQRGSRAGRSSANDVAKLVQELIEEGIDGLVIDLRNNGGGSLEEVKKMVGLFIDTGPVVQTQYSDNSIEVLSDGKKGDLYDGPLAVMINRLSASASEIFAGAIKDYGRGIIVGRTTYGKGTVQNVSRNIYRGQIKITTAKFYRINGDSTQHKGVAPDIEYPSLFNSEEIGEANLDSSLPWDEIPAAKYKKLDDLSDVLPLLKEEHDLRTKNNPDFVYTLEKLELLNKAREKKYLSLNIETRKKEQEANKAEQLVIENNYRKATGEPLLKSIDELDEDNENDSESMASKTTSTVTGSSETVTTENVEEDEVDAYVEETGRILIDYLNLNQQQAAMNL